MVTIDHDMPEFNGLFTQPYYEIGTPFLGKFWKQNPIRNRTTKGIRVFRKETIDSRKPNQSIHKTIGASLEWADIDAKVGILPALDTIYFDHRDLFGASCPCKESIADETNTSGLSSYVVS